MFPTFRRWFIPSKSNDYQPEFLGAWPVAILLLLIVGLYGTARITQWYITTPGNNLAAVVSAVLVDLANADRAESGLHSLAVNPTLVAAAQAKADDMAAKGYFAHTSPEGVTPWYWFQKEGYPFAYAGENLAVYFTDSSAVNQAWMQSPGHRANILSSHFTEIGIATAQGMYQGQPTTFVVQEFGAPTIALPAPARATTTSPVPRASKTAPATTTPIVAGASSSTPTLAVIHEDATFIAVKNASTTPAPSAYAAAAESTFLDRMLASPRTSLGMIYLVLAIIILIAIVLMIVVEVREQRPFPIFLGVALILIMALLLYLMGEPVAVAAFAGLL